MRCWILLLGLLGVVTVSCAADEVRPASVEELVLFKEAMRNTAQDTEHWAYTETQRTVASKGRPRGETVVRFDPSKHYAEQFTPLKIDGKTPSEKQLKEYRKRGEKRGEQVARAAEQAKNPGVTATQPSLRIGGNRVTLDLSAPVVLSVDDQKIAFEVPVKSVQKGLPADKFQVVLNVSRSLKQVESVEMRVRESFRVKLVAKVKEGEVSLKFQVVDPQFGPVIFWMKGDFSGSLLFVPVNGTFERVRTEWKRVKSYDERLQVKLGPLQFLDS
ncbi:hypothetical protein [Oleiharenicola lentus]|uniref:hypothetical protein n=1 Tax=Oleiharenicola lentus TaxID=2508720 RepID=UPI003F66E962